MQKLEFSDFGGIAGRILKDSMSLGTFVSGLAIFACLWGTNKAFTAANQMAWAAVGLQVVWAFFIARFAVNGKAGDWGGTAFSNRGGNFGVAAEIALRYIVLCAIWLVPLTLMKVDPLGAGANVGMLMMGMPAKAMALLAIYVMASVFTPPLFLIVAVSAPQFRDILSPAHWSKTFSGRSGDVTAIYAMHMGGLAFLCMLLLPMVLTGMSVNPELGKAIGFCSMVFASGFAATMLGKLCGFFAADGGDFSPQTAAEPWTPTVESASGSAAGATAMATAPIASAAPRPNLTLVEGAHDDARPPLTDARERVRNILEVNKDDHNNAIESLIDLRLSFADNPLVLHSLALLQKKVGDQEGAVNTAREAIPICIKRGNLRLAAEVLHTQIDNMDAFEILSEDYMRLAIQLRNINQTPSATKIYAHMISKNAKDTKAIKAMLQLAEHQLNAGQADEAKSMYSYLLEHCSNSPLADYMRQGLEDAERKVANG